MPMPAVTFAQAFRRHVDCPDEMIEATTVGEALATYFDRHPRVRGYVVDDAGALRRHVTVFADDRQLHHREALTTPVDATATIYMFQALSGG